MTQAITQMKKRGAAFLCAMASLLMIGGFALGQDAASIPHHASARPFASNLVVPQSRVIVVARQASVQITGVNATVSILEQVATTTLEISLQNPTGSRLDAELIVPVPDGAVIRGFTFQGAGKEPTAELLPKEEARRIYDSIVAKVRDPALLEFIGCNLIRSCVFPVEPRGTQKLQLTYENLLEADGNRIDYVIPRTESVDYTVPWHVTVGIKSKKPISTVYSPSHALDVKRVGPGEVVARIAENAITEPGAFRLSYLLEQQGVTASLFAYPDPKTGGGYFLLLAGLPAEPPKDAKPLQREVTLVIDRSGSMHGEKLDQVREAALQVIAGLDEGELFNIITYNEAVNPFAERPVAKTRETVGQASRYLKSIQARGGTNIHDALVEALRQKPTEHTLPIVLFLTDGLPTIGQTAETAIREVATKGNPHNRRVFTFGVGVDVNTPLLDGVALDTRATSAFVLPKEDVEVKVGSVFKRLSGPVLADPSLELIDEKGEGAHGRAHDVLPSRLPDLFEGDQLVLLGQYVGEEPLRFRLSGNYLGKKREFKFDFQLNKATTLNAFVPRLWASRKIAVLIDAIRALGADGTGIARPDPATDPRMKELVDEIIRLSREFGILTEYTAFLAREGTDLGDNMRVLREATENFSKRAVNTRSGWGSVNQSKNSAAQQSQQAANPRNSYYNEKMQSVQSTSVQQVNDRAFYKRGDRWVDSRVIQNESAKPDAVIKLGSKEFKELADRLAGENRAGTLSLDGDILMKVGEKSILVTR